MTALGAGQAAQPGRWHANADTALKVDSESFVTVLVSQRDRELAFLAERAGWNHFEVGRLTNSILVFRQMLPSDSFEGNFSQVPPIGLSGFGTHYLSETADRYVGEWAPQGRYLPKSEALKTLRGKF